MFLNGEGCNQIRLSVKNELEGKEIGDWESRLVILERYK